MIHSVISYLQSSAERFPERMAVSDCDKSWTYHQLWKTVSTMGSAIYTKTGGIKKPIVVLIKHDLSDIVAFYSIAFSGNFYIPVDVSLPAERIKKMLDIVRPAAIICSHHDVIPLPTDVPIWTHDDLLSELSPISSPWKTCKDTDLLYIMFTSGSTGEPKGVAISHSSVIDMVEQFTAAFDFAEGTVFGNQAPFDFDVSVKDIFLSAKVAGTLVILEKKLFSVPKHLINRLNDYKVDTLIWAVPALNIIAKLNAFKTDAPRFLKNVMFSGEIMPLKTLQYWMDMLPETRFVNLYGPTEITCNCTYYVVTDPKKLSDAVPIGIPFDNCSVFLLDNDHLVQEDGLIGEICVTGTCLAMGYYRRLGLTQSVFQQNPLNQEYPERMYRTGDLGCYNNGQLIFMGRKDSQIKHMGHRIEITEIILCANTMDGVESSSCIYDKDASKIILFYQGVVPEKNLYDYLRSKLPRYMLPGLLKRLDAFPKTRTGKIDNKVLMQMLKGE